MKLLDYFTRLFIIHLPERKDRYNALRGELRRMGIDIEDPRVCIHHPVRPDAPHGFPSRAVYSSFLSHLGVVEEAQREKCRAALILEDDAIFSRRFAREQEQVIQFLEQNPWDMVFFGHSIRPAELQTLPKGFIPYRAPFDFAHCYGIHERILPTLISYLHEIITNPAGHPRGAQIYTDGAYSLFRQLYPDVVALIANPPLSVQKGTPSSLAHPYWYDRHAVTRSLATVARIARDEYWRCTS